MPQLWQRHILNPLSEAGDRTLILVDIVSDSFFFFFFCLFSRATPAAYGGSQARGLIRAVVLQILNLLSCHSKFFVLVWFGGFSGPGTEPTPQQ